MTNCSSCGRKLDGKRDVCAACRGDLAFDGGHEGPAPTEKYCVECGEAINRKAEICPECGVRQPSSDTAADSDQVVAGVLAILLGGLGAHKFYQGNTRNGVLYLCLFWTAIPALVGLIEGILILVAGEAEYERKYADGSILGM
jgi:TM2 domain-containing membrane protein YozV/RNA polymerase subunit RPABC4/transcription elongation factor Spt4